VKQTVKQRGEQDAHRQDKDEAAKQRIGAGEDLARGRVQLGDRAHPAQNHRRVEERVQPGEPFQPVIASHPGTERRRNQNDGAAQVPKQPPAENRPRRKSLAAVLESECLAACSTRHKAALDTLALRRRRSLVLSSATTQATAATPNRRPTTTPAGQRIHRLNRESPTEHAIATRSRVQARAAANQSDTVISMAMAARRPGWLCEGSSMPYHDDALAPASRPEQGDAGRPVRASLTATDRRA
jgi:hypothetical protein